jgi:hypothetical protein
MLDVCGACRRVDTTKAGTRAEDGGGGADLAAALVAHAWERGILLVL